LDVPFFYVEKFYVEELEPETAGVSSGVSRRAPARKHGQIGEWVNRRIEKAVTLHPIARTRCARPAGAFRICRLTFSPYCSFFLPTPKKAV
jgi:hypothetical protein